MTDQMQQGQSTAARQIGAEFPTSEEKWQAPRLIVNNTLHDQEEALANQIIKSQRPVIIITEAYAESAAGLSNIIADTFPDVPVVCESANAEKNFITGRFCNSFRFRNTLLGHFTGAAEFGQTLPDRIKNADCIIVLGTPKHHGALTFALKNAPNVIRQETITNLDTIQPRVPFGKIEKMERPLAAWATWLKTTQRSRSL